MLREGVEMLKRRDFHLIPVPASVARGETMTAGSLTSYGTMSEARKAAAFDAFLASEAAARWFPKSGENSESKSCVH
jgi:hypothetical protein